jgi:hypothetical protein
MEELMFSLYYTNELAAYPRRPAPVVPQVASLRPGVGPAFPASPDWRLMEAEHPGPFDGRVSSLERFLGTNEVVARIIRARDIPLLLEMSCQATSSLTRIVACFGLEGLNRSVAFSQELKTLVGIPPEDKALIGWLQSHLLPAPEFEGYYEAVTEAFRSSGSAANRVIDALPLDRIEKWYQLRGGEPISPTHKALVLERLLRNRVLTFDREEPGLPDQLRALRLYPGTPRRVYLQYWPVVDNEFESVLRRFLEDDTVGDADVLHVMLARRGYIREGLAHWELRLSPRRAKVLEQFLMSGERVN